jgi:SAM-dependent methyltransferase
MALGSAYRSVQERIAGTPPDTRIVSHQWLATTIIQPGIHAALGALEGDILDVGCGDKPYERHVPRATSYYGIDVYPGPKVDAVIAPEEPWPLPDQAFDGVICTQVLEHARDAEFVVGELARVTRPGATVVASVPFMYPEHGAPHDYRRFSRHGARELFERSGFEATTEVQGAIGSSLGAIGLVWLEQRLAAVPGGGPLLLLTLPLWLTLCAIVNIAATALDRLDGTDSFYGNVLVVAKRT